MPFSLPRPPFRRPLPFLVVVLFSAFVLGLVGCDSAGESEGEFRVFVQQSGGAPDFDLRGRALFSGEGDGPFTVELVPRSDGRAGLREGVVLARQPGGVPAAGRSLEFALPDDLSLPPGGRFAGAIEVGPRGSTPVLYYAEPAGSSFTVTEQSGGRVVGKFQFRATRVGGGGAARTLLVAGTFSAEPGPTRSFPLVNFAGR